MHIMSIGKDEEHPYTAPARIVNGALSYETIGASGYVLVTLLLPF
jgi:hypothetical protein